MKKYPTIIGLLITFLLIVFFVAEYLQVPFISDPSSWLAKGNSFTALLGILLLTADVIIPVPASLVMTANGIYFGFALGSLLSLLGGVGSSLTGFTLGRYFSTAVHRLVSKEEWAKSQQLLSKWGTFAVIVTRPVPILSETMALIAGTSSMSYMQMLTASVLGLLPSVVLYGMSGALATTAYSSLAAFLLSLAAASGFWWLGRKFKVNKS